MAALLVKQLINTLTEGFTRFEVPKALDCSILSEARALLRA